MVGICWNTSFLLGPGLFSGAFAVSFTECTSFFFGIIGMGPTRWWFQLFFIFTPTYLGKMNPILTSIFFQMGGEKPPTRKMMNMSLKGRFFLFLDLPSEIGVRFMDDVWAAYTKTPSLPKVARPLLDHLRLPPPPPVAPRAPPLPPLPPPSDLPELPLM